MDSRLKLFFFIFFILVSTSCLKAQTPELDSLKKELKIHTKVDTTRVNILFDLAFAYHNIDLKKTIDYNNEAEKISSKIDYQNGHGRYYYISGIISILESKNSKALEFAQKALKTYQRVNNKKSISSCYNLIGSIYYYDSKFEKAIVNYKKSMAADEEIGDLKGVSATLNNLANVYSETGNITKALESYESAVEINRKLKNEKGLSNCYNNIGIIYMDQGNYPLALEYYHKSAYLKEKLKDTIGLSYCYNGIGSVYKNQNKLEKSLDYFNKSISIQTKYGSKKNVAKIKNNIGLIYVRKNEIKKALFTLNESLSISEEVNDLQNVCTVLNNIADIYLDQKNYKKARIYYQRAEKICNEIQIETSLCNTYVGLANTFAGEKTYDKAKFYLNKGKVIANKLKLLNRQADVAFLEYSILKENKEYEKALESYETFKLLSDSLLNKENLEKSAQLEVEYKYKQRLETASNRETKLKKTVTHTSENLKKSERKALFSIIALLCLTIVSASVIFFMRIRNLKSRTQTILIEQKLLRSQMTPHFIFNSLSVLQGLILNKKEDASILYLSRFSKLLRTILENSRHKTVQLTDEIEAIENYMALHNFDSNPAFHFELQTDIGEFGNSLKVPPMLIQPFIENAIEHAFTEQIKNREISVNLLFNNNVLSCIITDNGIGIESSDSKKNNNKDSLATTITNERIEILSKDFKVKGSVTIKDRKVNGEKGTIVTLIIPFKIEKN